MACKIKALLGFVFVTKDVPVLSTGAGTEVPVPGRYFEVPAPVLAPGKFPVNGALFTSKFYKTV